MFESSTQLDVDPVIEPGSSAADSIEQALDRARNQSEIDAILTRQIPYTTTITDFDRLGRIQCRNIPNEHFDQLPVDVIITDSIVKGITNSVSTSVGASLTTAVEASVKSSIPGGTEASVKTSVSGTVEASKTVTNAVQTQLSRSVGVTEKLAVTFHADDCFEQNNPYGLCLEITITGSIEFKQDATISRGSDGLLRFKLQNTGVITSMTIDKVDVSLDPCVKPDESPKRIGDCQLEDRRFGRGLPVDSIQGIGQTFADRLREFGILSVDDLANVDLTQTFDGISRAKLLELRAKARMFANTRTNLSVLRPLGDRTAAEVLDESPDSLRAEIDGRLPLEEVVRIQEHVAGLFASLDDSFVRNTTLSELL